MSTNEASSNLYKQNKCDSSASVCSNCELLMKQIHNVLEELESAKLIIKLLQKERDEDFPHGDKIDEAINSGRDKSAVVYSNRLENNTWTVTTGKDFHLKISENQIIHIPFLQLPVTSN